MTTNTPEPVAWYDDALDVSWGKTPPQTDGPYKPLYPESALQAERERAERWEEEAKRHCRNSDNWRERAEKAAAERDQLRAELAALKGAIKAEANHNPFCSIGHLAEHGSLYKFL